MAGSSRRAVGTAATILAIAVLATVAGLTAGIYRGDGSSINAFLFLDLGLSHATAACVERTAVAILCLLAGLSLAWPRWFLLVPISIYLLLEAMAGYHVRGYAFSELTPAAHSLRFLTPLALVLMVRSAKTASPALLTAANWLLRLGLAVVFMTHGYEAFQLHPEFIDFLITTAQRLLGMRIEERTASTTLQVIGVLDFVAAALLLIRPWRAVLMWMVFWGAVTALSRMTSYGWAAHTDVLLRFTHFAVPLALLLTTRRGAADAPQE